MFPLRALPQLAPPDPLKPHLGGCKDGGGGARGGCRFGVETPWRHLVPQRAAGTSVAQGSAIGRPHGVERPRLKWSYGPAPSAGRRTALPSRTGGKRMSAPTLRVNGRAPRLVTAAPSLTRCHISEPSGSMRFGHRIVSSICTSVGRRWRPTRVERTRSALAKAPCSASDGSFKRCFSELRRMACWSGIRGAGLNAHQRRSAQGCCCLMPKSPSEPCCLLGFSGF